MASIDELTAYTQDQRVRRFLDAIGSAEGTDTHGYNTAFGGGKLESLADHPRQLHDFTQTDGTPNRTSAAGRYQFLQGTWDDVAGNLGLKDFGPESQDIAAVELLRRNGALPAILADDFDTAIQKSGSTWASLPSSPYAQPKRSPGFMAAALDKAASAILPAAQAAPAPAKAPTPWKDVIAKPEFQTLTPEQQAKAQQQYFDQVVAPRVPAGKIDAARAQFMQQYGAAGAAAATTQAPKTSTEISPDGIMTVGMAQENPTEKAAPPEERNMLERLGRQVGLTARAGVTGLTGLTSLGTNTAINGINALFGTEIPLADVNATLSAIGLPEPENATERVAQDAAGAMAGAGGVAKAAQTLVNPLVNSLGQRIAAVLSKSPLMQIETAMTGGASAGVAREAGGGPVAQLVAGIAGGMGPALAQAAGAGAIRGALRGGEAGRQTVAENLAAFKAAGTTPTVGQATQRKVLQGIETGLSQAAGGSGVMLQKASSQADELAGTVEGIVRRLAPRAGAVEAGESISRGLEGFKAGVKNLQGQLYDRLDDHLPAASPITVSRTKEALRALNSDLHGAQALGDMFKNGKIQGVEKALLADLDASTTAYGAQAARKTSTLPYESIKKLRTLVGKEIDNATFVSDVPRDKWKALYAALSDDLGDAAQKAGPDAYGAWRWANQFSKDQLGRLDDLAAVAGRDTPEKIFNAAMMGTADGDTILQRVVSALPKTNRRDLAAAVVKRMGRATAGNQNEAGDVFSSATFLSNWNKLSPEARSTLFGRIGEAGLTDELMNLARVSSNIKSGSRYLANPSGTSSAATRQLLALGGMFSGLQGNWPALAGFVAAPVGANLLARPLVSRALPEFLSRSTEVSAPVLAGGLQALFGEKK
ncbi:glycoside hydrolase family 104 protein [Achromobacter denitrificans]|uniref:glycoside hydrolase family 24 protein n=1 Tax=Achromobacter denitrificans TaxID=32002 RepID=UPI003B9F21BD